ncbi:PBECR2 nuclease fold domain-containing protein [Oscillospiraceae bacterium LCP25S3_E10]|nr:PBECR2 nuclease fold domain-containing protein [Ruminococcus sp.]
MAVNNVHTVGKIDIDKYKCVTDGIKSSEVIITDERIQHIKDRHPNDYEKYCGYMRDIVSNPDYIIEANKPNTALLLKSFSEGGEQFKTILRLVTSSDNPKFKNSIITFMKINEREWQRLLRNKKTLYKSE